MTTLPLSRPHHFQLSPRALRRLWWAALAVVALLSVAVWVAADRLPHLDWTLIPASRALASGTDAGQPLVVDGQGAVWLATANGVGRLGPDGQWSAYPLDPGWVEVTALAVDGQRRPWVGSWAGLSVLGPDGRWTTYTSQNSGLASDFVSALAIDRQGRVWVGTHAERGQQVGLSLLSPDGRWTTYTPQPSGLADGMLTALAVDAQGQLWLGGKNALQVLSPAGQWTTYPLDSQPWDDGRVRALVLDPQGRAWVGTGSGLSRRDLDGRWTTYWSSNSGLVDNLVNAVAIDPQGSVWAGTPSGVSVLAPDGRWTSHTLENSGLELGRYGVRALALDPSGRAWLTTAAGLLVYDPRAAAPAGALQTVLALRTVSVWLLALMLIASLFMLATTRERRAALSLASAAVALITFCQLGTVGAFSHLDPAARQNPWLMVALPPLILLLPLAALVAGVMALRTPAKP